MKKSEQQLIWESYTHVKETTATDQNIDRIRQLKKIEKSDGATVEELETIQQVLDELISIRNSRIRAQAGKTKQLLYKIVDKLRR